MSIQILIFYGTQNIKTLFIQYIVLYLTHSACQNFGIDYMNLINTVKESDALTNFSTELEVIKTFKTRFQEFKKFHILRRENEVSDFLPRTAKIIS